jgi:hypothetical protein
MATPASNDPKHDRTRPLLWRGLTGLLAFGVFMSGWMAMRTQDWRQMVLWTVIAAGCAWFASRTSIRSR